MEFLHRQGKYADAPRPDLVLLDLNLPKKNGHEVLADIRGNPELTHLPVVVLSSSEDEEDVQRSYDLHANAYLIKPALLGKFVELLQSISQFWLNSVTLPPKRS